MRSVGDRCGFPEVIQELWEDLHTLPHSKSILAVNLSFWLAWKEKGG